MAGLGLGLFIGSVIISIGWISVPKKMDLLGSGVLLILGGMFIAVGEDPVSGVGMGALGFGCMAVGVVLTFLSAKKASAQKKEAITEELLEIGGTNLDMFFVECVLSSCNDFRLEKNVAKAKLLADKYSLSYLDGIQALYEKGLKAHESISDKIISEKLADLREKEQEEYNQLIRYSSFYGKDKKIAMLTNRMNELRSKASSLDKGAKMLMRSTQQRERDWAIWGGIADGLAGPAAGIATAIDIQTQNAQIRAQNEVNMRATMPAYMSVTSNASQNRTNANAIEKEIQLMKEKLISDISSEEVFAMLRVISPTVEVSETGAFKVTATVETLKKLFIFDDVPAVADGTLVAHVFEDDKEIGTATMVLPVNGVSGKTGLIGMALSGAHQDKKQTVTFTKGRLWLMEK